MSDARPDVQMSPAASRPLVASAGIPVRDIPDACTDEVADHAVNLLLAAWRHLVTLPAHGRHEGAGRVRVAITHERDRLPAVGN